MTGSLIEYVVYCCIVCVLIVGLMQYAVVLQHRVGVHQKTLQDTLQATSIQSALTRDLWQAPSGARNWYKVADQEIVWHTDEGDIGWYLQGTELYRVQGSYDQRRQFWQSSHKGLVSRQVTTFKVSSGHVGNKRCSLAIGGGNILIWEVASRSMDTYG